MMMFKATLIFMFLFMLHKSTSDRILAVIPMPFYSHQYFYQSLWRELAHRGHELVVITTDPTNEQHPNLSEISIAGSYAVFKDMKHQMTKSSMLELLWTDQLQQSLLEMAEYQLNVPEIQQLLNNKSQHFDLIIVEHLAQYVFAYGYHFKCPVITIFSMDVISLMHKSMGNGDHYILYPSVLFSIGENSILERIKRLFYGMFISYCFEELKTRNTALVRKYFGEGIPTIHELMNKIDMLFINSNPLFGTIRPYAPSTISLAGGMHIGAPKELPKEIKLFLDGATKGAIYLSLGSSIKDIDVDSKLKNIILDTLKVLPYRIIWKSDNTSMRISDNVMLVKWAPQHDILGHTNVKLFISQGGIQSLEEALYFQVPTVMIPFFNDQHSNSYTAQQHGLGISLDRLVLTATTLERTILEVIQNGTYKDTVRKLSTRYKDLPMKPLDNAVWWTEYVLRHNGSQHLKGPIYPFYQQYYLDILTIIIAIIVIIISVIYVFLKYLFHAFRKYNNSSRSNKTQKAGKKIKCN